MESLLDISKTTESLDDLKLKLESIYECQSERSSLNLSTIHSSKGLEYDCVFIIDLNRDEFPGINSSLDDDLLEEERRLFYVAMTRAKESLFLISQKLEMAIKFILQNFMKKLEK